jgi:hypothetical protein
MIIDNYSWLINNQSAVLFYNQPTLFLSQNKSTLVISQMNRPLQPANITFISQQISAHHQSNEQASYPLSYSLFIWLVADGWC